MRRAAAHLLDFKLSFILAQRQRGSSNDSPQPYLGTRQTEITFPLAPDIEWTFAGFSSEYFKRKWELRLESV